MTTSTEPEHDGEGPSSTTELVAARDGTKLLVRRWRPAGEAWASVLLVHGLAEHSGRYEHVGRQMAATGLDAVAYDVRGYGASGGRRAWVDRWSRHHDDLEDRLAAVRASSAGRPVVLFGHSLGALLALGYCVAEPSRPLPDALVLSAPAIASGIPRWKIALARVLGVVAPSMTIKNDFDGAILSRDPEVGRRYLADPLNEHVTTARLGAEASAEQARVRKVLERLSIPTLVYHGEADRLVPTVSSVPFGAIPAVVRRTWPKLRHETHNEPEGRAVIAAAIDWVRATVGSVEKP
ncbi:MAG TPA: lysophospholipase [Candidatus Deferrimicrobium sp.]|nr:lysophospholipase [Candidatus Deferrimicrobium sp.]